MTRLQACIKLKFGLFPTLFICFTNWLLDIPEGTIKFMHFEIEY